MTMTVTTSSTEETVGLGRTLSAHLRPGDIVLLSGPLGAGKTAFVRGVVTGLDPAVAELVTSQSYVVVVEYPTRPKVAHLDLYRLSHPEEVLALGIEEILYNDNTLALVEWPGLLQPLLEPDDPVLALQFDPISLSSRSITAGSKDERLSAAFTAAARVFLDRVSR